MKFLWLVLIFIAVAVLVNFFPTSLRAIGAPQVEAASEASASNPPATPVKRQRKKSTPAAAAPETPDSAEVSALVNRCSKSLLVVDGDESMGSASIIKWKGNCLIVTNIHVLSGNSNPSFRLLSVQKLSPNTLGFPPDRDIAVASQQQIKEGLEASTAVDADVAIGDEVIVLGNSLGSSVFTEIKGKILGIGPDLIETDAKFVHGNSGSPIIHVKTGKVIGIATFATVSQLDTIARGSQFTEVRRFGYRFDTVANWQFVTAQDFAKESGLMAEIKQRSEDLFTVAKEATQDGAVRASHYPAGGWVRGMIDLFRAAGPRSGVGGIKFEQAFKAFREKITDDIEVGRQTKMIPYNQKQLANEADDRKTLVNYLAKINWYEVPFDY